MNGVEEIKRYRDAGFPDEEIGQWRANESQRLSDAGFSQGEIETHFGEPPFDPAPVIKALTESKDQYVKPTVEGGAVKPITTFEEAIRAGFGESTVGLLMHGKPTMGVDAQTPRSLRIASQVAMLAGDIPAMGAGFLLGGGPVSPVTGTAGAFALPAGIRRVLMDKFEKGEVATFADFWDRASGAFIDTAKGWITGAATGAVGKAIGLAPVMMSRTAQSAVTMGAEIPTMVTVGKALEGQVPNADDFIDTALALGFLKGSAKAASKLRKIYAETGITPEQVAADAAKDPTIHHDLASENVEISRAYRQPAQEPSVEQLHALAKERDIPVDDNPAFMALTEQVTGKRHLDDLIPAERSTMASALEEWQPNVAMGGGAPPKTPGIPAQPSNQNIPINEAQQKILDRIVQKDPATSRMTLEGIYTSLIDNLHPIKQALKRGGKYEEGGINAYTLERLTRGVMGKGQEFIKTGAFDFDTYQTVTKGYEKILEPVKKDLDGFRAYLASKRAVELAERGIETGFPLDEAKTVVKAGQKKYQAIHEERLAYRDAMLDYLHKSGVLSTDALTAMREANKDYVPFYRFFEDDTGRPSSAGQVRQPIQKIKGSERQILDPIVSDIKDTFLFIGLAEKNAARQSFVQLGPDFAVKQKPTVTPITLQEQEIHKLFDEFVKVKKQTSTSSTSTATTTGGTGAAPTSKQTQMIVERVREALTARGFQPGETDQMIRRVGEAEAGKVGATVEKIVKEIETTTYIPELDIRLPNDAATVFRALRTPVQKDEIVVFTKGKREVYKVDPPVAEAFNDLDRVSTNMLAQIVHAPASWLRAGVTITPDFIARNIMRDAVSSFIYANSNPWKTATGLKSMISRDDAFHKWMKGGGANATMVAIDRDYIQQHLVDLNTQTGLMQRAWNVAKTPFDLLRAASELVENSTRIGTVRSELLKTQDKAKIQALSLLAREATVDFSRHGRDTQEFAKATAFFNPALQGIDRINRAFANYPLATTAKALGSITVPSLLLWWANRDDKEIQDLPRWQKDLFWLMRVPLPGGGSYIQRIPKPFEPGIIFGSLPERLLDQFVAEHPDAMKDITDSIMQAFLPSMIPTAAVPIVSQFANKKTFTGGPLIPSHLEGLLPEYQYAEYTTETAKALGQIIGAFPGMEQAALTNDSPFIGGTARALTTPILLEQYLRDWTGGMGYYLLQMADASLRKAGVVPDPVKPMATLADLPVVKAFVVRYPSAQSQSIQDFYEAFGVQKTYFTTIMTLAQEGDPNAEKIMKKHVDSFMQLTQIHSALGDQSKFIRLISKNPEMTPSDKRQLIDTTYYRMIELSQAGNETLRQFKTQMSGQQ